MENPVSYLRSGLQQPLSRFGVVCFCLLVFVLGGGLASDNRLANRGSSFRSILISLHGICDPKPNGYPDDTKMGVLCCYKTA
ncbi:hypothetical protein BX661DRAFT_99575 [Kickxella alabastrina]|uniref:uncharacterized protein n=1 Tax=Kickxella alabastrina TaxID=61397 RepID=UPI00222116BB|nr:uncharacterized protein BX661DRAFT_84541 [Kickxella alabastrina]XP_051392088.1 uncharacterized protein BX661DRAFT_99575 [Kickxella alabastrina]KAI7819565.1 hypothetical protein BX661DRAFT_84541 [Kickxella alabastrina]KAI7829075.1 hypothetical protein BX661DRAFT_99575 [Kickxella alabastrina]